MTTWADKFISPILTANKERMRIGKMCKKCGDENTGKIYHKDRWACSYSESSDDGNIGEHLHYFCRSCSYTWTGKCADQEK